MYFRLVCYIMRWSTCPYSLLKCTFYYAGVRYLLKLSKLTSFILFQCVWVFGLHVSLCATCVQCIETWFLQEQPGLLILELSLQLFTFQRLILRLGDEAELVECLPSMYNASPPAVCRLVRGSIGLQFQYLGGEDEGSIRDSASSWVIHSEVEASPNLIN